MCIRACFIYRDLEKVMPNIVLQVIKDLRATLEEIGAGNLSTDLEVSLEGQITDLIKPDHKIRSLVSKYNKMLHLTIYNLLYLKYISLSNIFS